MESKRVELIEIGLLDGVIGPVLDTTEEKLIFDAVNKELVYSGAGADEAAVNLVAVVEANCGAERMNELVVN